MRRLKLQMQITADGVVAGPEGQLDWMTWNMDESVKNFRKLCENEIAVLSVLDRKLPLLDLRR